MDKQLPIAVRYLAERLERRSLIKVVITAAANKLARIAWAVLSSGQDY
jgi:hypothetical protein